MERRVKVHHVSEQVDDEPTDVVKDHEDVVVDQGGDEDQQDVDDDKKRIEDKGEVQSTLDVQSTPEVFQTPSPAVEQHVSSAFSSKFKLSYRRTRKISKSDSSSVPRSSFDFFMNPPHISPPPPHKVRDHDMPSFQLTTPSPIIPPTDSSVGANVSDAVDTSKEVEEGPAPSTKGSLLEEPVEASIIDESSKAFDETKDEDKPSQEDPSSSAKDVIDLSSQQSSEHTPSQPIGSAYGSVPGFGESAPSITPLQVNYLHVDGSYSSIEQTAPQSPKQTFASQSPISTLELLKGWDHDSEDDEFLKSTPKKTTEYIVIDGDSPENQNEEAKLESLIVQIKQSVDADTADFQFPKGVEDKKEKKKEKKYQTSQSESQPDTTGSVDPQAEDSSGRQPEPSEVHTMDNAVPVNNHRIILSRTLQRPKNKYLGELSAEDLLVADFLFYSEYEDVYRLSVNPDDPVVAEYNLELKNNLELETLVDMVNPSSPDQYVQLTKYDFLSLAPRIWISGQVIDACVFMFNRREEQQPGIPRKFWFNMLPFNHVNWLNDHRENQKRFNSIIAEKEIELEKAEGTPRYDAIKSEIEGVKAKMVARSPDFFQNRCRIAMSTWERSFPNNSIRDADLIFVPVYLENHFTVPMIYNLTKTIEDIDNRSDNKHFEKYQCGSFDMSSEMCRILADFLQGDRIKREGVKGLQHWSRRTIPFPWRSNQNSFDCGLYAIKAMEWYNGHNEKDDPIASLAYAGEKNLLRCKLAVELLKCKDNRLKNEVMNQCFQWSAKKPELLQRQLVRKKKEKDLDTLKNNRANMVFAEDENIREQRRKHEKEVEDVLNDFYEDSVRLAAIFQYRYDQWYEGEED